jgi:hypothetical protein
LPQWNFPEYGLGSSEFKMNRWVWFGICAILGLVTFICGWLVPQHLRAVDDSVLQKAGRDGPALIEHGLALVKEQKLGAAQLLLQAARQEGLRGQEKLDQALGELARQHPELVIWGMPEPRLQNLGAREIQSPEAGDAKMPPDAPAGGPRYTVPEPVTEILVRLKNREQVLGLLGKSQEPAVQELLRCRALTNTVVFPPSQSSSGQAFDTAISLCGLLLEDGYLSAPMRATISALAMDANHGAKPQRLEEVLLNLMSIGQRFNWGQLVEFTGKIDDTETLRVLAIMVRKGEIRLPVIFSAIELSGKPAQVTEYLKNHSETGLKDLGASLRFGAGGVNELLRRNQRLFSSGLRQQAARQEPFVAFYDFAADSAWLSPRFALAMKWVLYLTGGFLLAMAMHLARPAVSELEQPLQVGGFHVAREILFALGFLLVVLVLSEPFLAQENQKEEFHFRLQLPTVGSAVPAGNVSTKPSLIMNNKSLLTLLLFFVLQALLYTACVFKLAEIRRQRIPPRIKLKLLENEEHLFDAGLYLGFAGTIISFILVSMGITKPSLMAAYGSTSFGVVFVSIFKIFHLRPARRKLLLEAENPAPAPIPASAPRPTFAAPL